MNDNKENNDKQINLSLIARDVSTCNPESEVISLLSQLAYIDLLLNKKDDE